MNIFLKNNLVSYGMIFLSVFFSFFILSFSPTEAAIKCDAQSHKKVTNEAQKILYLEACDKEIAVTRKALSKKQGETSGVKYEIRKLDQKIKLSELYVNQKLAIANRLKRNINETENDIKKLNSNLERVNKSLKSLIFQRNQVEANTALEAILSKKTISEFFGDNDTSKFVETKIAKEIKKVKKERDTLQRLTIELEEKESVERDLAYDRKKESVKIVKNKKYKRELLNILKKEEGGLKITIGNKEKAKRAILAKVFKVASGAKVSFGEAYNIINPYKRALGMDPAFVMAILFQESGAGGKIGGNIGQCTYKQYNKHGSAKGGKTMMKNSQHKAFESIMKGLGRNAKTQKISCAIPRDGGYGGAMGPAQFMPNTWMEIRASAGKIVGKSATSMSPFTNQDSFVASAAYLKKQYYSASCNKYARDYKHIQSTRTLRERCAASRYYAGGNWFKFRMSYGESVVRRANRFRADIKTLNS